MSSSESSRRFHFIREIASGGFGSVYLTKVIHADGFSRLVAVKLLHPRWSENEEIASRMRDEARLLGWLRHKNIVDVMDLTLIDGRCAIIMEYLEAIDTKVVITDCVERKTAVPLRAALEMCAAVASALDAAYNRPPYAGEKPLRVIHRDIKPSNIMVDDSGVVKVLDFGVARAEFDERESKTQELAFGSLEYMPPERLFFEPESPASDVYSLGATLYELLALEKFGKAKLRAKEHEAFFEDRFDVLLDQRPLNRESEDLLHDLLMGMLAFDEPDRPSAADCVSRMRSFARRIQENPLEEWAEQRVPTLLAAIREREEPNSPGSLVGTVLVEDVRALDQRSIWEENTGMSTRAVDLAGLDEDLTGSLAEDARWKALKQATIEEMAKKGELGLARRPPDVPATVKNPTTPPQDVAVAPESPSVGTESPTPSATVRIARPDLDEAAVDTGRTLAISRSSLPRPSMESPTPDLPPPEGDGGMRRLVLTAVVVFFLAAGVSMVAFAAVGMVVALLLMPPREELIEPAPMPLPSELPEPFDLGLPSPLPVADAGPKATFVSAFEGTTRLVVSCGETQSASGVSSVELPGEFLGTCTVRGRAGSTRLFATLNDVEGRRYTCFADDQRTCD